MYNKIARSEQHRVSVTIPGFCVCASRSCPAVVLGGHTAHAKGLRLYRQTGHRAPRGRTPTAAQPGARATTARRDGHGFAVAPCVPGRASTSGPGRARPPAPARPRRGAAPPAPPRPHPFLRASPAQGVRRSAPQARTAESLTREVREARCTAARRRGGLSRGTVDAMRQG